MQNNWLDLPVHPRTGRRAVGIVNGKPVWPILGGAEGDDAEAQAAAAKAAADAAAAKAAADAAKANDSGFPSGTPVDDMTPVQQAAYWKHHARKHEDRAKTFGNLTPEQFTELQTKAKRAEELERDLMSDKDKAVEEAKDAARKEALAEASPRLVRAEFRAAGKGVLTKEQIDSLLEDLDTSKYVTDKGDVDEEKVSKKIAAFAPAKGTKLGPSAGGTGSHQQQTPGSAAEKGRAEAQRRGFGKKTA